MTNRFATDQNELFQMAWLKIREKEINGCSFEKVRDYQSYFYLTLRNVFLDLKRKHKHNLSIDKVKVSSGQVEEVDSLEPCQADLITWMYEETKNENDLFYKNILILQTQVKKHKDVQEQTKMDRRTYLNARKEAAKKAKNEIIDRIRNINDSQFNCLV